MSRRVRDFALKLEGTFVAFLRDQRKLSGFTRRPQNVFQWLARRLDSFSRNYLFKRRTEQWATHSDVRAKTIYFICNVWGEEFVELAFRYCIPSVMQEGNLPALVKRFPNITFCVYTDDKAKFERQVSRFNVYKLLQQVVPVEIYTFKDYKKERSRTVQEICADACYHHATKCIDNGAISMHAQPDNVYGNGSLVNIFESIKGKAVSVAVPHPRVSYESVVAKHPRMFGPDDMTKPTSYANSELVRLAFENLAYDWVNARDDAISSTTHRGISWRKLNDSTYCVVHNMPVVILTQYTEKDKSFLDEEDMFTTQDRGWQSILLKESRLKVVASSDLFFSFELTPDEVSKCPLKRNPRYNDELLSPQEIHNFACNSVLVTWRS